MDYNARLSIALNLIDRKIANLNMNLLANYSSETKQELHKYLNIKKEIYKNNILVIEQIINNEGK